MKNKLWTFGDSFSESFNISGDWKYKYLDWKGYIPKTFSEIISEDLNLTDMNMAKSASDNYTILQRVCNTISQIKPEDVIIIGWSQINRFRLATPYGRWKHMIPNGKWESTGGDYVIGLKDISKNTLIEIFCNREDGLYTNEVRSWVELLNYTFLKNTIIQWSPFKEILIYNNITNLTTITEETKGVVNDYHYSEEGHVQLANELKKILTNPILNKELI